MDNRTVSEIITDAIDPGWDENGDAGDNLGWMFGKFLVYLHEKGLIDIEECLEKIAGVSFEKEN